MIFDSQLRRELAQAFGVTLVVIVTIVLTSLLITTLGRAAGGNIDPQDVLLLMGYASLSHLSTILILSLFIAIVMTLGRMYKDSEMAIWFSSGLPLIRFVPPVLRTAAPVVIGVLVLELAVTPWGNQNSEQLRDRYERRSDLARVAPGQFQTSADGSRVFFIDRDSKDSRIGRNVFILAREPAHESVTTASQGHVELGDAARLLVLDQGQRNDSNLAKGTKTVARFEHYTVRVDERVAAAAGALLPKTLPTLELLHALTPRNAGELTWRFGWVLASLNMVLLGVGLAATNPRRPNSWSLLFALLSFIVYFNLINLSQGWVNNQRLGMGSALLALHGCAALLALGLICLRDRPERLRFGR